ncbi:MAG: hypothetical protein GKR90_23755 [Pseudomonadales bacterium]|nr:hypothetical protein [Pseudomonadales bacterium]
MNLFQIIITAVLTTFTIIALAIAGAWSVWPRTAEASIAVAAHSTGWRGESNNHCERFSSDHLALGEAVIAVALDLDDAQKSALEPIRSSLESWRTNIVSICEGTDHGETMDVSTGLQAMEDALTATTNTVVEVRPQIESLLATLNPEQNDKLMGYLQHHRRSHGFRGRH